MKLFVIFLLLLISSIEPRRHNDDLYGIDDLLGNEYNHKHRAKKPDNFFDNDDDDNNNNDDDDAEEFLPVRRPHENSPSSHRKRPTIKEEPDEDYQRDGDNENDDVTERLSPTTSAAGAIETKEFSPEASLCLHNYDIKPEQLIKVKELKNGAHLIRHEVIDKNALPSNINLHDSCMLACCREKTCDLAMMGEQPTRVTLILFYLKISFSYLLSSGRLQMLFIRLQWQLWISIT